MKFNVANQTLSRTDSVQIVADSTDYLTAEFTFTTDWDGCTKTAYFDRTGLDYPFMVELSNNAITADKHLNLAHGDWFVYVVGINGSKTITTNRVKIFVSDSGVIDGEPFPVGSQTFGAWVKESLDALIELIKLTGDGTKYLADDGVYKTVSGGGGTFSVQIGVYNGYICYRATSSDAWIQIISLADLKGANGRGIGYVSKQGSSGLVDTYIIVFDDGTTTTFNVTNGAKGDTGDTGATGQKGADGLTTQITLNGQTYTQVNGVINLPALTPQTDDFVLDDVSTGTVSKEVVAGKLIKISNTLTSLTLTLPATTTWHDTYAVLFKSAAITLPTGCVWDGGTAPTITNTKWYVVTIVNNIAFISKGATL